MKFHPWLLAEQCGQMVETGENCKDCLKAQPRFLIGGRSTNSKSHVMISSKVFQEGLSMVQKYREMKIRGLGSDLTRNQSFAKERKLEPCVKNFSENF